MKNLNWIAVDWGTSRLRAWAMAESGEILDHTESDQGMSKLAANEYENALLDLIASWISTNEKTTVIACGMVGSRQGWIEVPYAETPCQPIAKLTAAPVHDERLNVQICSGIMQQNPPDVMRGEETQIAGFLASQPDFAGVICLPGTHTKWAKIKNGEIRKFQTFMTGELHGLLAENSVLRHSIDTGGDWDEAEFLKAVNAAMADPSSISGKLFSIRAEDLLHGLDHNKGRARLSGYLIGLELAATRPFWETQKIAIIGAPKMSAIYQAALHPQDVTAQVCEAETMTLAGLGAASLLAI